MSGYFVLCAGCDFTRDLCVHFMRRKGSVVMTIKHFTRHDIDSASGLMEANFVLINACLYLVNPWVQCLAVVGTSMLGRRGTSLAELVLMLT